MSDTPIVPDVDAKIIDDAVEEAGRKALAQSSMTSNQAQRLFYEYWNAGGHKKGIEEGAKQFRHCMAMADEIRKICDEDFIARVKRIDAEIRSKASKIIIPSARQWEDWRFKAPQH